MDGRRVVLTGGSNQGESQASVTELNVWRGKAVTMSLPDLNSPREGHACGIYLKNGIKVQTHVLILIFSYCILDVDRNRWSVQKAGFRTSFV